jgi:hypothetical protein
MSRRSLLLLLAALALCAAWAPSAGAMTQTDYAVTIEGSASYVRHDADPGPLGDWTQDASAEWSWKATIPSVTFFDNRFSSTSVGSGTGTVKNASYTLTIPTPEGPKVGSCTGKSWETPPQAPVMTGTTEKPEGATSEGIYIRVMDGAGVRLDTCSGTLKGSTQGLFLGSSVVGRTNAYETFFEMPHEAVGMGKIIQLIDRTVTGTSCPGYTDSTDSCTLKWKATVTFVRTFHAEVGEPEVKPAPQEEQAPAPPSPPAPKDDLDDLFIPLPDPPDSDDDLFVPLPGSAKLAPSGASASVAVLCPTGCTGTAVATPLARGARAAAARKALARTRFAAKPGRRTTVRLRFGARARRAVRRAGGVRIALSARPRGSAPARHTVTLRSG